MLEETGHAQLAAEAAGVSVDCIYRLRRVEKGFARRMDKARDRADRRLHAERRRRREAWPEDEHWDPDVPAEVREGLFVVRRGSGGRFRQMAAGTRFWTDRHDAIFLGHLRATGNVAASARATGFTPKTAYNRRDRLPAFAAAWERELVEADRRLEQRVVGEAIAGTPAMYPGAFETGEPERLDPWLALNYLKWRERRERRR